MLHTLIEKRANSKDTKQDFNFALFHLFVFKMHHYFYRDVKQKSPDKEESSFLLQLLPISCLDRKEIIMFKN